MEKDLTQGSIVKTLVLFSLPLVLSGLLQQLYSWADAFIVGNVEGELQLAAIGATGAISGLIVMIITGFTLGITILTAHMYGAGERTELKKVLSSFALVLGVIFLVVAVLGALCSGYILKMLQTPLDIAETASSYLCIIFAGVPFLAVYNVYAAVLRGIGDSRTPFLSIVVSAVTNVLLDILLVAFFRCGAAGAAAATVISQILMTVFIVIYSAKKYPFMKFRMEYESIDSSLLKRGFKLSIPTGIQSSVHSMGNLLLQNFMNSFGTQTVAAITTAYRIDTIILLPINNLGSGVSTITAQNMGAGDPARARKALYVGIGLMSAVSIALTAVIIPTGGSLIAIFGVLDEAVEIGKNFFRIIALFYLPFSIAVAIKGYLEGIGDVVFSGVISIISLIVRIVLSYGLKERVGNAIIAYAEIAAWILLLAMCIGRFLYKVKVQKRSQAD